MKEEINLKRIAFFTLMGAIMLVGVYFNIDLPEKQSAGKIEKFLTNINEKQKIAPQRLYINAWRKVKNEYYDISMNSQDWYRWRYKYLDKIQTLEDAEVAINTMIASLNDQSSAFLVTEQYKKQKIVMNAQVSGIGANLKKTSEGVVIDNIIKDSPADVNELAIGDALTKVNDTDIKDIDLEKITNLMDNNLFKKIKVQVERDGKLIDKEITVLDLQLNNMTYYINDDNIAYIKISNLMGNGTIREFGKILLKTNDAKGLIIDLRNNYGGILTNAINIADLMMSGNLVVCLQSRGDYKFKIYANDDKMFVDKPVVILTNNSTASSAEILAGTLRDNLNAVIVGEQTYGKNTIQKVIPMQNMTGILLTTGKYILPKGEDIHEIGLIPDVAVYNNDNIYDNQLHSAFDVINLLVNEPGQLKEYIHNLKDNNQTQRTLKKKVKIRNIYKLKKKIKLI